jgi:glycosyltransferase involved in cell wall biosynthesis
LKKVLIICYYWPPAGGGGVQRWLKFTKYLPEYGWEPIVYVPENPDYPLLDPSLECEISSLVNIIKHPIREPYDYFRKLTGIGKQKKLDPGFLSQGKKLNWKQKLGVWVRGNIFIPDARCMWIKPSVSFLKKYLKENPVDQLISTGPPHSCHVIGAKLKAATGLPWLADLRDPWTQIDYFNDLKLNFITRYAHQRLEKKTLDAADIVTVVGPTMAEMLGNITSTPIKVITNGYDEMDFGGIEVKMDEAFSITYIGTINDAQNPHTLWKALEQLKYEAHPLMSKLRIRIVGTAEQSVKDSISDHGLEKWVHYTGYVSHTESIRYQRSTQLLLLLINNTWNNKLIVTGKVFEYITSGRPIICIGPKDGDAAKIVYETQTGSVFNYREDIELTEQIKSYFYNYKKNKLKSDPKKILNYSRKKLTENLVKYMEVDPKKITTN